VIAWAARCRPDDEWAQVAATALPCLQQDALAPPRRIARAARFHVPFRRRLPMDDMAAGTASPEAAAGIAVAAGGISA